MKLTFVTTTLVASIVLAAGACGGSSTSAESPKASEWKTMDHKQRAKYMAKVVLPKTKEIFAAFDPKFKDMDCKTCHGDGETDGTFKMPNPKIRPLPTSEEQFNEWVAKEPDLARWGKFMGEQVEPLMAQLLGEQVMDMKTGKGEFSCLNCHTTVGGAAPAPAQAGGQPAASGGGW